MNLRSGNPSASVEWKVLRLALFSFFEPEKNFWYSWPWGLVAHFKDRSASFISKFRVFTICTFFGLVVLLSQWKIPPYVAISPSVCYIVSGVPRYANNHATTSGMHYIVPYAAISYAVKIKGWTGQRLSLKRRETALCRITRLTVVCETKWSETKRNETKWNETKWKSVVCEMRICSLRNENPLENADFKFSVNNELKEKTSPRNRGAEGRSLSTAKATPTTRDRGIGDWNQRHYDHFTLSKTQIS